MVVEWILWPYGICTRGTGPHGDKLAMNCIQNFRAIFIQTSSVNTYVRIVCVQGLRSFTCICALVCENLFKLSVLTACARCMSTLRRNVLGLVYLCVRARARVHAHTCPMYAKRTCAHTICVNIIVSSARALPPHVM